MTFPDPITDEEVRRQLLWHLRALYHAGVEWIPQAAAEVLTSGPVIQVSQEIVSTPEPEEGAAATQRFTERVQSDRVSMDMKERLVALRTLENEVKGCVRCAELCSTRTQTVFGQGRAGVEICFVGEAPGAEEDAQGLPFVGPAGQLLNRIITACGWQRDDVYICNVLKCRPPGNRTPLPNETANCRGYLIQQLKLIRPRYLVMLGSSAASTLLNTTLSLGKLRGRLHEYEGIPVVVTYHPAYLLPHRNPAKKREVWEDMKMLLHHMGKPIPQAAANPQ